MMKNKEIKIACIGSGCSGTGQMVLFEKYLPGSVVAFCDRDRSLFDKIIAGYLGENAGNESGDFKADGVALRPSIREIPFYTDAEAMLRTEAIDAVIIATYDESHFEMVQLCVKYQKHILLEKPIAINRADIEGCWRLLKDYPKVSTVNFTMRGAPVTLAAERHRRQGTIGKMVSVQYVNNVHYGDVYFRNWMRTKRDAGSLLLQKATHDFDIINHIIGLTPLRVSAFGSRQVYGGNKPNDLTCDTCDEKWSCPMSIYRLQREAAKPLFPPHMRKCVYAKEIDIDDNHTVIIEYEGGVTASYSQTFNAPMRSGTRGGYFIGTEGIMHLQYYGEFEETPSGQMIKGSSHLDITQYHQKPDTKLHEVYDWAGQSHFDGTEPVMLAKIDLLQGKLNTVAGTIREGYISAMICLAAQESIETGKVISLHLNNETS